MKICAVIFSTNRPEYLERVLASQDLLDFSGCELNRIFIDDYPRGRDNAALLRLVNFHGYRECYLHESNQGIGLTWTEFWKLIAERDYDYVWHQEDDMVIRERVLISDLIEILQSDLPLSQVALKRAPWYAHEVESGKLESDIVFGDLRVEMTEDRCRYFVSSASLYPIERARYDYAGWLNRHCEDEAFRHANINEGLIGKVMIEQWRDGLPSLIAGHVKNREGMPIVEHIGAYTVGKKLLAGEPGYERYASFDPDVRYDSRTELPF